MKIRFPILLALAGFVPGGCTGEMSDITSPVSVSVYVGLQYDTKAASDGDGDASSVNRCILQVWAGDEIDTTIIRTAPAGTGHFEFKGVMLLPENTYDFLFWADCGTETGGDLHYTTASLKSVGAATPAEGNDDALDAFCGCLPDIRMHEDYTTEMLLTRPLAQMNLITEDFQELSEITGYEDFRPVTITYSYYGCTAFNVYDGSYTGGPQLITVPDIPVYSDNITSETFTLAMAYVFPSDGEAVTPVTATVNTRCGASVSMKYENIPLKRNWRTNIRGHLLTVNGNFSVTVVPFFSEPDY